MKISRLSISAGVVGGDDPTYSRISKRFTGHKVHIHTYLLLSPTRLRLSRIISFTMGSNSASSDEITFSGKAVAQADMFSDDFFD